MNPLQEAQGTYTKQATDFLEKTGATFEAKFLYYGPHFEDDKESRDVYEITFKQKGNKDWVFKFGQSIVNSSGYVEKTYNERIDRGENMRKCWEYRRTAHRAPCAYDVLACITKNDPGTFSDFCADYGYDTDSRKAEKTYFAVQEEYKNCVRMFGKHINELAEIQ